MAGKRGAKIIDGKKIAAEIRGELKLLAEKIDVIKILREDLINKNKSIEHITVDDIRASLKEIKQTHLNKNTTLIAKKKSVAFQQPIHLKFSLSFIHVRIVG